jgi:hypothetical protein
MEANIGMYWSICLITVIEQADSCYVVGVFRIVVGVFRLLLLLLLLLPFLIRVLLLVRIVLRMLERGVVLFERFLVP